MQKETHVEGAMPIGEYKYIPSTVNMQNEMSVCRSVQDYLSHINVIAEQHHIENKRQQLHKKCIREGIRPPSEDELKMPEV